MAVSSFFSLVNEAKEHVGLLGRLDSSVNAKFHVMEMCIQTAQVAVAECSQRLR